MSAERLLSSQQIVHELRFHHKLDSRSFNLMAYYITLLDHSFQTEDPQEQTKDISRPTL